MLVEESTTIAILSPTLDAVRPAAARDRSKNAASSSQN
jgi:hypothetical protein